MRDAAKTRTIISHATVSNGSAHQTRREVPSEAGAGGGRGTLEPAVTRSLLFMASMTVTEVTTRIAVVGAVSLLGLLVVARLSRQTLPPAEEDDLDGVLRLDRDTNVELVVASDFVRSLGSRLAGVFAIVGIAGTAIGVGLSLLLVVSLNALSLE